MMDAIKKIPNWAKALILGGGLGFIMLLCLGGAFFFLRPTIFAEPTPMPSPTFPATFTPLPTHTATPAPPTQPPPTLTATATEPPTSTPVPEFCHTFAGIPMSVVYMDWFRNEPLEFYVKMSGGVLGLEKEIPDAGDDWVYTAKIGDYTSGECKFIPGYPERLYCEISLPSSYEENVQPLSLFLNKCEGDIYTDENTFLPQMKN